MLSLNASLLAQPDLRAPQQRRADESAHVELLAVVGELDARLIGLAVGWIENAAALPGLAVAAQPGQDRHAEHRLALSLIGALLAAGVGLARRQDALDATGEHAAVVHDAHERARLLSLVVDRLPEPDRRVGGGKRCGRRH